MEFIREDCIYARQSVDRKDSISIESQIDFCKYELKGGSCRVFKDKGYSGKNTDRPEFQKLLGEIRKGKVRRVIVYKLDRISRSILDFANMMELFQEYDVEFVSSTEKFDTSTPMGRAMLNICIVFAQLERETIQKRVTDAYYSRCLKGFHMSGQAPYGYQLEPTVVEGIRTKKMVADPVAADHVRLMFEMYAEPETSFGDITRYFEEQGIKIYEKSMVRSFLSQLLRNPVYAQADLELYEFFKSQGAAIVNDASDFAGTNGCYLYQGRDVKEDKDRCLKDQILVIAPHEALIPSDTWLKCRKKLMANTTFQQGRKPKNTWLAGKIKCGHCGYALKATHVPNSTGYDNVYNGETACFMPYHSVCKVNQSLGYTRAIHDDASQNKKWVGQQGCLADAGIDLHGNDGQGYIHCDDSGDRGNPKAKGNGDIHEHQENKYGKKHYGTIHLRYPPFAAAFPRSIG